MTRSEYADLFVRAERFMHIFGSSAAGLVVKDLYHALKEEMPHPTCSFQVSDDLYCELRGNHEGPHAYFTRHDPTPAREKVS